ncbi:MAG: DUF2207 domain-containing protein [Clostridia bacterium]|nr:DUF2207 domain-containing protein [Clostridia bacterium]
MIDTAVLVLCAVLPALPLIASLIALIRGRIKLKNVTEAVEFYPPKGFSPLDVMTEYYADHCNPKGIMNPLMLYWADKGYIKLEEDCRRGLKLTKLKDLEAPKTGGEARLRNYRMERGLFDKIFGGNVFYTLSALSSYREYYDKFVKDVKEEAKRIVPKKWTLIEALISAFSVVSVLLVTVIFGIGLDNTAFLTMIFPIVALIMLRFVPLGVFKYLFFAVWGGAPMCAVLFSVPPAVSAIMLCSVVSAFFAQYVILPLVDLREEENLKNYARIKGFKKFLVHAEKPQLEMLVEENPNYYFDILPYCYVLNITKKVKAKFDKIRLDGPAPYLGAGEFGDYRDTLMY